MSQDQVSLVQLLELGQQIWNQRWVQYYLFFVAQVQEGGEEQNWHQQDPEQGQQDKEQDEFQQQVAPAFLIIHNNIFISYLCLPLKSNLPLHQLDPEHKTSQQTTQQAKCQDSKRQEQDYSYCYKQTKEYLESTTAYPGAALSFDQLVLTYMALEPVETTGKAELVPTHTFYMLTAGFLLHYCQTLLATLTILRQILVRSAPIHRQPVQSLAAVIAVLLPAFAADIDCPFLVYCLSQITLLTKFTFPNVDHPMVVAKNDIDHLLLPARQYVINTTFRVVYQLTATVLGAPANLVLLNLLFYMSQQTFLAEKMGAAE